VEGDSLAPGQLTTTSDDILKTTGVQDIKCQRVRRGAALPRLFQNRVLRRQAAAPALQHQRRHQHRAHLSRQGDLPRTRHSVMM